MEAKGAMCILHTGTAVVSASAAQTDHVFHQEQIVCVRPLMH